MAKSREKKSKETEILVDRLRRMKVAVITATAGLTVKDVNGLRSQLRKSGIDYLIAKKTLIRRALKETGLDRVSVDEISGSFSIAFGYDDEITAAKLLHQFAKTHEALKFYGGILEGSFTGPDAMLALAKLPGKDGLRSQLVGTMTAPVSGFVRVLAGNLQGLLRVLAAHHEQRADASSAPAAA